MIATRALACWERISDLTRLLFAEPSPAPAKYWLARTGLIDSAEVRLPMVEVSAELAAWLDEEIERRTPPAVAARVAVFRRSDFSRLSGRGDEEPLPRLIQQAAAAAWLTPGDGSVSTSHERSPATLNLRCIDVPNQKQGEQ